MEHLPLRALRPNYAKTLAYECDAIRRIQNSMPDASSPGASWTADCLPAEAQAQTGGLPAAPERNVGGRTVGWARQTREKRKIRHRSFFGVFPVFSG